MNRHPKLDRRLFLGSAASIAAVSATACIGKRKHGRFLTEAEIETLRAVCDQIVPADALGPGGAWAGVVAYVDRQLSGHFRQYRTIYRAGLAEADRRAGGRFSSLPHAQQKELLQKMEKEPGTKTFFSLVVDHTMQGFYGSPRHGGNRDYCSWRMLRIPASPVRGREQYDFSALGDHQ